MSNTRTETDGTAWKCATKKYIHRLSRMRFVWQMILCVIVLFDCVLVQVSLNRNVVQNNISLTQIIHIERFWTLWLWIESSELSGRIHVLLHHNSYHELTFFITLFFPFSSNKKRSKDKLIQQWFSPDCFDHWTKNPFQNIFFRLKNAFWHQVKLAQACETNLRPWIWHFVYMSKEQWFIYSIKCLG